MPCDATCFKDEDKAEFTARFGLLRPAAGQGWSEGGGLLHPHGVTLLGPEEGQGALEAC